MKVQISQATQQLIESFSRMSFLRWEIKMYFLAFIGLAIFIGYLAYRYQVNQVYYRYLYEMESVFQNDLSFVKLTKGIIGALLPRIGASGGILFWQDNVQSDLKIRTVKGIPADKIHTTLHFLKGSDGIVEQAFHEGRNIYRILDSGEMLSTAKAWLALPTCHAGKSPAFWSLSRKMVGFLVPNKDLSVNSSTDAVFSLKMP
jgi:hypothetical protein